MLGSGVGSAEHPWPTPFSTATQRSIRHSFPIASRRSVSAPRCPREGLQPYHSDPLAVAVGRAFPFQAHRTDERVEIDRLLEAVEATPADAIVVVAIDAEAHVALWGGLMTTAVISRGGRGAVVDGGIRDLHQVLPTGFPVWARYRCPLDIRGRAEIVGHGEPVDFRGVPRRSGRSRFRRRERRRRRTCRARARGARARRRPPGPRSRNRSRTGRRCDPDRRLRPARSVLGGVVHREVRARATDLRSEPAAVPPDRRGGRGQRAARRARARSAHSRRQARP